MRTQVKQCHTRAKPQRMESMATQSCDPTTRESTGWHVESFTSPGNEKRRCTIDHKVQVATFHQSLLTSRLQQSTDILITGASMICSKFTELRGSSARPVSSYKPAALLQTLQKRPRVHHQCSPDKPLQKLFRQFFDTRIRDRVPSIVMSRSSDIFTVTQASNGGLEEVKVPHGKYTDTDVSTRKASATSNPVPNPQRNGGPTS